MEQLPLFPLHTVLFPGGLLPLHIFEERSRTLIREERNFGVVLIREGGDPALARELLEGEAARHRQLGRTAVVHPDLPSSNWWTAGPNNPSGRLR